MRTLQRMRYHPARIFAWIQLIWNKNETAMTTAPAYGNDSDCISLFLGLPHVMIHMACSCTPDKVGTLAYAEYG